MTAPRRAWAQVLARAALEAAAPAMASAVAVRIAEHMDEHWPAGRSADSGCPTDYARIARRHFRAAAQVAALTFSTREDQLRMAAEALNQGDFIACPAPETRETGS